MPKYIDANKLVRDFTGGMQPADWLYWRYSGNQIVNIIEHQPAADVEPVRHGHWIMYAYDEAICSECNYDRGTQFETTKEAKEHWDELPMWCEGCGAKMDKEADNGTSDV